MRSMKAGEDVEIEQQRRVYFGPGEGRGAVQRRVNLRTGKERGAPRRQVYFGVGEGWGALQRRVNSAAGKRRNTTTPC